ncbi:MAG TPA: hypothetical protein VMH35_10290 [Streptosporangiaceae bacterium]|nr:hypothetical protein [Streptosporangiaceae bacterium]
MVVQNPNLQLINHTVQSEVARRLAREEGAGVVVIEHRVDEVAPWADRVVLMDGGRVLLDQPPRVAWADRSPWLATGVGVPDIVQLAHALPGAFPGRLPLSVPEAVDAVRDTWFSVALAAAAAARPAAASAARPVRRGWVPWTPVQWAPERRAPERWRPPARRYWRGTGFPPKGRCVPGGVGHLMRGASR